jgi:low temperature requirement protein LtrA
MQKNPSGPSGGMPAGAARKRFAAPTPSSRVTTFELFFDLVYVFAFTQVSRLMADTHSALGVLQALVVLGLLWLTWCAYAWLGNHTAADHGLLRVGLPAAMVGIFIVALTIPEAYDDLPGGWHGPLVLVVAYTVVRIIHASLYVMVAGDDQELRRRVIVTQLVSTAPAVTGLFFGALVGGPAQTWIWLAALLWDLAFIYAGARGGGGWRLRSVEHWVERHGLVVILALGESIVAIGVGVAREPIDGAIVLGTVLSVTISVLLWQAYFARIGSAAEAAFEGRSGPARVTLASDAFTYGHTPIIAGIILAALGVEDAMAHIHDVEGYGWFGASVLGSGLAIYLASTALFARLIGLGWLTWRVVGALAVAASIPLLAVVPPMAALAAVAALMGAMLVAEATALPPSPLSVTTPTQGR